MSTPKSPKVIKVHADGCSPSNLELFKGKDSVVFVQSGPGAPTLIHVNDVALFGSATCAVGASAEEATVYPALTPGNYLLGITPADAEQAGKGSVQVLCLGVSGMAFGDSGSGSIKVTR